MTLKDWKKKRHALVDDYPGSLAYLNTRKDADLMFFLTVFNNKKNEIIIDAGFDNQPDIYIKKFFKTKLQALKYAKSYMRSH